MPSSQHIVSYPISQGQLVNLIGFVTVADDGSQLEGEAVVDVPKQEMLDHYVGWEPQAIALLNVSLASTLR